MTEAFPTGVGLCLGSAHRATPRDLLYANDLVIMADVMEQLQQTWGRW